MPPFSEPVCVCVCVYKWGRAMQMACMYPVVSLRSSGWPPGEFTPESVDRLLLDLTLCAVCESRPGRDKRFIFRSHILNVYSPSYFFFYGRESEVENTWLLSLSLVFTEAFALLFCSDCLVFVILLASSPPLWVLWELYLFNNQSIYGCLYFFNWHFFM